MKAMISKATSLLRIFSRKHRSSTSLRRIRDSRSMRRTIERLSRKLFRGSCSSELAEDRLDLHCDRMKWSGQVAAT